MAQFQLNPGQATYVDPTSSMAGGSVAPQTDDQKKLRALIERRHPEYAEKKDHWDFLEDTYEGGREWFKQHIFRYIKEGETEFADRVSRAYRFNHSREVVDLLNKYLFKQNITRNDADAPESVRRFWKRSTRNGLAIKELARQISKKTSIYGRVGIVVDNTAGAGDLILSKADEKNAGVRTYAYIVGPEQLLDYAFDESGALEWILIEECVRDAQDPLDSSGEEQERWRLWTKNEWILYQEFREGRKKVIREVGRGQHSLGIVPVVLADNIISDEEYCAQALIDEIAYLDRAVANYLSNLDAIIQDQTFSQLAMPAQNVLPGEDNYTKLTEMGTKRIFLYDGESNTQPFYLSPDPKQAQMILAVINKIINEIYHTVGLAGERTKADNAVGIDNSSGVAKAYDFERVNALLAAKADSLEAIENRIAHIVAKWSGEDQEIDRDFVSYPDDFDTRGLYDEFDIAARLALIGSPNTIRQEQMKSVVDKLFPQLAKDLRAKMLEELEDWPQDPADLTEDPDAEEAEEAAPKKTSQGAVGPDKEQ